MSLQSEETSAQTDVSGTITTTTWTAANQPYHVTAACTIAAGNTLTIEPGVDVLFDADANFVVEGALDAVDKENDSTRFLKGTAAEWSGVSMSGGDTSTIAYARFSGLVAGYLDPNGAILADGVWLDLSHAVIRGNSAENYGGGPSAVNNPIWRCQTAQSAATALTQTAGCTSTARPRR